MIREDEEDEDDELLEDLLIELDLLELELELELELVLELELELELLLSDLNSSVVVDSVKRDSDS